MTAPTPAVERAANALYGAVTNVAAAGGASVHLLAHQFAMTGLTAALSVDEIAEALAREQWSQLPLVVSGEMIGWDHEDVTERERKHFRDRCRPYAEAVVRAVVGRPS